MHNFLYPRIVKELKLKTIARGTFSVKTIKGNISMKSIVFPNQQFALGDLKYSRKIFLMGMSRYEIILGKKWLQNFGNIYTDFEEQWIELERHGNKFKINGSPLGGNNAIIRKN